MVLGCVKKDARFKNEADIYILISLYGKKYPETAVSHDKSFLLSTVLCKDGEFITLILVQGAV